MKTTIDDVVSALFTVIVVTIVAITIYNWYDDRYCDNVVIPTVCHKE